MNAVSFSTCFLWLPALGILALSGALLLCQSMGLDAPAALLPGNLLEVRVAGD